MTGQAPIIDRGGVFNQSVRVASTLAGQGMRSAKI